MRQIFQAPPWILPEEHPRILEIYRRHGRSRRVHKGSILKGGAESPRLFLLEEGLCAYLINYDISKPSVLSLIVPGRVLGDITTVTRQRVNVVTRALRTSRVLEIPPEVLTGTVFGDPETAMLVTRGVIAKEESCLEGMVANFTLRPAERLRVLLKVLVLACNEEITEPWTRIPLALNNEEYGAIVHATRITVSRTLSQWQGEGLVRKEGRRIDVRPELFAGIYDWLD